MREKEGFEIIATGYMLSQGYQSRVTLEERSGGIQGETKNLWNLLRPFKDYIRSFVLFAEVSSNSPTEKGLLEPFLGPKKRRNATLAAESRGVTG